MRRRWLGLLLGILVLATAPGCRVIAGAAIVLGEAAIEAAFDGDGDDDDASDRDSRRREKRPEPRRAPAAPRDPCR